MPAASASVTPANRQAAPVRSGRSAGSTGRSSSTPPPSTSVTGASTRARPSTQPSADRERVAGPPPGAGEPEP